MRASTRQSDERLICAEACMLQHRCEAQLRVADTVGTAQEALKAGTQEPSVFDQHHYRWLTHASKICNRRQRGRSDASVVPFLDIWALEFHKRHGRLLRQQIGGANGVVDPVVFPFHRSQISRKLRGLERGTHAIRERHPCPNTIDNAGGDTKSRDRGNVLGDKPSAATQISKTGVEGLAWYSETARSAQRRASCRTDGSQRTTAPSPFGLRELQTGNRRSADAVCISGDQRDHRKTTSGEDGGGSRGFSVDGSAFDFPLVSAKEVCGGCCGEDAEAICKRGNIFCARETTSSPNATIRPIVVVSSVFCSRARSGRACPHAQPHQSCFNDPHEERRAEHSKGRTSDRCSWEQCNIQPADDRSATRRLQKRCETRSEYAGTSDEIDSSSQPAITLPRDHVEWARGHTYDRKTCRGHAEPCSAQIEASLPLASLDGLSEAEVKARQTSTVERRVSQVPSGQVAARIRSLELMSAVPMPFHFQPAGHTRHARVHKPHRHVDDEPAVELIFPLHIRRFPRRTSTGSPIRPESPIHRSIPQEESYIHSPQPARSMPMLRDPPEAESKPETGSLGAPQNNQEDPAMTPGDDHHASENSLARRKSQP